MLWPGVHPSITVVYRMEMAVPIMKQSTVSCSQRTPAYGKNVLDESAHQGPVTEYVWRKWQAQSVQHITAECLAIKMSIMHSRVVELVEA